MIPRVGAWPAQHSKRTTTGAAILKRCGQRVETRDHFDGDGDGDDEGPDHDDDNNHTVVLK